MSPEKFIAQIKKGQLAPAYLFYGPEMFERERCRRALIEHFLLPEERESGFTRHDLSEVELAEAMDDARSLSLFASNRVIWMASAEAALPRGRATVKAEEDEEDAAAGGPGLIQAYVNEASPGTVVIFDCSRYGFDKDDQDRLKRLLAFYSSVPVQVEFRPYSIEDARFLAQTMAKEKGLQLGIAETGMLVEALAADATRIASEIEKLSLYCGAGKVTPEILARLVPNASETTVFELVNSIGRGDRKRSLQLLDALVRTGEYLPLVLTFLAGQFRMAMVSHEKRLTDSRQINSQLRQLGFAMWPARADQVAATVRAFPREKCAQALEEVFEADRALRDTRPDDRIVMERLILKLTA